MPQSLEVVIEESASIPKSKEESPGYFEAPPLGFLGRSWNEGMAAMPGWMLEIARSKSSECQVERCLSPPVYPVMKKWLP